MNRMNGAGSAVLTLLFTFVPAPVATAGEKDCAKVQRVLEDLVQDFREDPFARDLNLTVGVKVKDVGDWYLTFAGAQNIAVKKGALPKPAPYYGADLKTLLRVAAGELGIMTSMGRAQMSDKTPMDYGFADGYQPTPEEMAIMMPFTFHFWTRGQPEVVRFGELEQTRVVHGAHTTLFYYQPGMRSAYYRIEKGQHINADEADQANPFPSLFIFIGGEPHCRIGGREIAVRNKQAMLVPAGVSHEFWNPNNAPAELIVIMFGEGA